MTALINFLQDSFFQSASKKIINNVFFSLIGFSIASGTMFLVNILIGRHLGVEQYGVVSLFLIIAQIVRTVVTGGMDVAIAQKLAQSNEILHSQLISSSVVGVIMGILVYLLFVGGCIFLFDPRFFDSKGTVFLIFVLATSIGLRLFF